ncbi:hypothetical protein O1W68_03555 [Rhodococcus sp. H36-A4]|uniref:hypothetical protein n=1 Tax=Rhodococcus sp. H36-A4 TaxID=3004353 RepID=UPI0022AF7FD1|nr:hypothetical protein [Rhodococcus sp. H36-A4]MCZ4077009.1 hypothetical protein [Rhodococcus sp. H36-A4]
MLCTGGEEYNDRIEQVNSARSIDQVTATLVDLPPLLPGTTASEKRKKDDRRGWLSSERRTSTHGPDTGHLWLDGLP